MGFFDELTGKEPVKKQSTTKTSTKNAKTSTKNDSLERFLHDMPDDGKQFLRGMKAFFDSIDQAVEESVEFRRCYVSTDDLTGDYILVEMDEEAKNYKSPEELEEAAIEKWGIGLYTTVYREVLDDGKLGDRVATLEEIKTFQKNKDAK